MNIISNKTPKLRFIEFSSGWKKLELSQIYNYVDYRGRSPTKSDKGIFLLTARNIKKGYLDYNLSKEYVRVSDYEKIMGRGKPMIGDVVFTTEAPLGNVAQLDRADVALAQRVIKFRAIDGFDNSFIKFLILSPSFRKSLMQKATGGTVLGIKGKVLHKMTAYFPVLEEQRRIANFLASVEEWVKNLRAQKTELERYRRSVLQNIFSQKIRFKDKNGSHFKNWEEKRLGEIFMRVKRKNLECENVLTISAVDGLINQQQFFNKSVSSKDLSAYTLLHRGEFTYNKSYSTGYPMGAIKMLKLFDQGVVSPLYICFKLSSENNLPGFFEHYFNSGLINKQVAKIAQEGARNHGLLNIRISDFFNQIVVPRPTLAEQEKITKFISSIDLLIDIKQKQVELAEQWKKGLLQQMFV